MFLYLLWVVPAIITLESHALDFRKAYKEKSKLQKCPLSFEPCENPYENNTVQASKKAFKVPVQFVDLDYIVLDSASIPKYSVPSSYM